MSSLQLPTQDVSGSITRQAYVMITVLRLVLTMSRLCYIEGSYQWSIIALLDTLCVSLLYFYLHGWSIDTTNFDVSVGLFTTNTLDIAMLVIGRILLQWSFRYVAITVALNGASTETFCPQSCCGGTTKTQDENDMTNPLLDKRRESGGTSEKDIETAKGDVNTEGLSKAEQLKIYEVKQAVENQAKLKKNCILAVLFLLTTATSVYTAIKCVMYDPNNGLDAIQKGVAASLMASGVLWSSLEILLLNNYVESVVSPQGILLKSVHIHPLHYSPKQLVKSRRWCDICMAKIMTGMYQCKGCGFDICEKCYKKKSSQELNKVRGDKGSKAKEEITVWQYLIRSLKLALPYWGLLLIALVTLVANSVADLWVPSVQGNIINYIIEPTKGDFKSTLILFVVLNLLQGAFLMVRNGCFRIIGSNISTDVRDKLFRAIIFQDIAFFDGATTGELTSRMTNDASAMVSPLNYSLTTVITSVIRFVGGLVMACVTSWQLTLLAATGVGPGVYLQHVYAKWSRHINYHIWSALGDANSTATETLSNIRTVRAFGAETHELGRFNESTAKAKKASVRDALHGTASSAASNYLDLGASALVLGYGGYLVMDGRLEIGALITFQLYWGMINGAFQSLIDTMNSFTRAAGAAQRVFDLMDNLPDIDPEGGKPLPSPLIGNIKLENVEFTYQSRPDTKVLQGINLDINAGQVVAFVGASGGGKSTLVHLLMRFYDPTSGRITIDGIDMRELKLQEMHSVMGLVAQDTQLFASSIAENIAYGLPKDRYSTEDIYHAAKLANAHDFIMKFDDKYDTVVGERGIQLSGGQKQRLAIARVLLRKPRLLFLDEATSALDTENEALVQEALDTLISNAKCTVVLVAHRLSTVMNADTIAVVNGGVIAEVGNHDSLTKIEGGIYAKLVSRQIKRAENQIEGDKKLLEASAGAGGPKKEMTIDDLLNE